MITNRDFRLILLVAAAPAVFAAALAMQGLTVFWGDLTYIHHPWRALTSDLLTRGILPLWNPYVYLGMPLAAEMQCATWYPGTVPFFLFPFAAALRVFHAAHFGIAGLFCFLWLRKEGLGRAAAFGGAVLFMGCGSLVSRLPFLNHLSCIAFLPAFLLFRRAKWLLAAALALCFLSGYPTILAGGVLVAIALPRIVGRARRGGGLADFSAWGASAAASMGLASCLLLPALRLSMHTRRGSMGLGLDDTLGFAFSPTDWRQWIGPLALSAGQFSPATLWWKTCYLGAIGLTLVVAALFVVRRRAAVGLGLYLSIVGILMLGGGTPLSLWAWTSFPPFHYVRYPGNLAFMLMPAFALLAAAALHRRRRAWIVALALAVELGVYAARAQPTVPSAYFTDAGPLVRQLQRDLEGSRYLLSPRSLQWHRGAGATAASAALDLKHRLYGLTNAPFHLRAVGNFGEPLVPRESYDFMDTVYSASGLEAVVPYLGWSDASLVMTREKFAVRGLEHREGPLWEEYWLSSPAGRSRAHWLDAEAGSNLPSLVSVAVPLAPLENAEPLSFYSAREDRYRVQGSTKRGWAFVSEPPGEGWHFWLNGRPARPIRALGAFVKFEVPQGRWRLDAAYDPVSWKIGCWLSLLSLMAVMAYWYNRICSL